MGKHRPPHRCKNQPARDLDDVQRDAEEMKDRRAKQRDDRKEDGIVDGDLARQHAIRARRSLAHQAKEDERGANRINQRQQRAEGDEKGLPELEGGFHSPDGSRLARAFR